MIQHINLDISNTHGTYKRWTKNKLGSINRVYYDGRTLSFIPIRRLSTTSEFVERKCQTFCFQEQDGTVINKFSQFNENEVYDFLTYDCPIPEGMSNSLIITDISLIKARDIPLRDALNYGLLTRTKKGRPSYYYINYASEKRFVSEWYDWRSAFDSFLSLHTSYQDIMTRNPYMFRISFRVLTEKEKESVSTVGNHRFLKNEM